MIDHEYIMDETLRAVAKRLQEQLWLNFARKFQVSAICDGLLIGSTTANAISVGRHYLATPDDQIELFHFLFNIYENQFLISY